MDILIKLLPSNHPKLLIKLLIIPRLKFLRRYFTSARRARPTFTAASALVVASSRTAT